MKRTQNVIIFSAGESVRNGKAAYIKKRLEGSDVRCLLWEELFCSAHDKEHVALLPSLTKKIPTFDFALILAEGVDEVQMRGTSRERAMRDNVIFEMGLCVMALGADRVILLAEDCVHIPDDLAGIGALGVRHIIFSDRAPESALSEVKAAIRGQAERNELLLSRQIDAVLSHIQTNAEEISPVYIGAAVSSAEAYFMNFVVRLLENREKGFAWKKQRQKHRSFPQDFELNIVFPVAVNAMTGSAIQDHYTALGLEEFVIEEAGSRGLFFRGFYDEKNNKLTIVDVPTSVTASYCVVSSILNIVSDDEYDGEAEERFAAKEMDVFIYALKKLLTPEVAEMRLSYLKDGEKRKRIIKDLQRIRIQYADI